MKSQLLFYHVSRFNELKSYYNSLDINIASITEAILDNSWVEINIGSETVIDISSLCSLKENLQINAEKVLPLFDSSYTFIIDSKYRCQAITEFRFCFDEFIDFEDYILVNNNLKVLHHTT